MFFSWFYQSGEVRSSDLNLFSTQIKRVHEARPWNLAILLSVEVQLRWQAELIRGEPSF